MMFPAKLIFACAAALLAVALPGRAAEPPPLAEHQIKALYLFNFTKYVEWPAATSNATPFVIGVCAAPEVQNDLVEITRNKCVQGRPIVVRMVKSAQEVASCHVLFIGTTAPARVAELVQPTRNVAVLTVGNTEKFLALGGMINFVRRENTLRLEIGLDTVKRAQLVMSAKLLAVAGTIQGRDGPARN